MKMTRHALLMLTLPFMMVQTAGAAQPGSYVGIGAGSGTVNAGNPSILERPTSFFTTSVTEGAAGRLFAGYNFNEYFGVEAGFSLYPSSTHLIPADDSLIAQTAHLKHTLTSVSLVGKAYLPLGEGFNVYALGGVAGVNSKAELSGYDRETTSKITRALRPVYGAGLSHAFTPQLTGSVELSEIRGTGNADSTNLSAIPNARILTVSAAWNFG